MKSSEIITVLDCYWATRRRAFKLCTLSPAENHVCNDWWV